MCKLYMKIIIILGNVASASTKNDSAQNETSNRSSETRRAGSETPNDESDRYKDERGILYFFKVCTTCLTRCKILNYGQLTRMNGELMKMNGMKKRKMRMRTKKYLIA